LPWNEGAWNPAIRRRAGLSRRSQIKGGLPSAGDGFLTSGMDNAKRNALKSVSRVATKVLANHSTPSFAVDILTEPSDA
jgi:hypothetical protein